MRQCVSLLKMFSIYSARHTQTHSHPSTHHYCPSDSVGRKAWIRKSDFIGRNMTVVNQRLGAPRLLSIDVNRDFRHERRHSENLQCIERKYCRIKLLYCPGEIVEFRMTFILSPHWIPLRWEDIPFNEQQSMILNRNFNERKLIR